MKKKYVVTSIILPLIAAFIWGSSFTAQGLCVDYIPPFLLNGLRSIMAAIVLFLVCLFVKKKAPMGSFKDLLISSLVCGVLLFGAINLQQIGIAEGTDSGKAGFITAIYTVIMPIIGIFVHKPVRLHVWVSIVIAMIGMYFLCITGDFTMQGSDVYVILCALCFAVHMYALNYFTQKVNSIALTCGQFLIAGIISMIVAFCAEDVAGANVSACVPELIYMGIFSSCIAYTLQTISLRDGNPTMVSLLFCLESVFAVISGAIILGEKLTARETLGCVLMLIGVVMPQLPLKLFKKRTKPENNEA